MAGAGKEQQETRIDLALAQEILDRMTGLGSGNKGQVEGDLLMPLLQEIQKAYGYLPAAALALASERTGIPESRMYGVATFYAQFHLQPHGKHAVRCCRGTACHVRGGAKVISAVKNTLALEDGETSADMQFSFETVACLGACAISPVMVVDSAYYGKMAPGRAGQILEQLKEQNGDDQA